jgi:hypothetical protein
MEKVVELCARAAQGADLIVVEGLSPELGMVYSTRVNALMLRALDAELVLVGAPSGESPAELASAMAIAALGFGVAGHGRKASCILIRVMPGGPASAADALPHWLDFAGQKDVLGDDELARYRAALEPPSQRRELMLDPRKGSLVELDHAALERVDRATLIGASYAEIDYDESLEQHELPALLVDRITVQVPFGTDGESVRARMRLSDEGRQRLASVARQGPVEAASALAADDFAPVFVPAVAGFSDVFVLRGQPVEQALFAGVSSMPALLVAIAAAVPKAVSGKIDDFELDIPAGPLPGGFPTRAGLSELRDRLSLSPHTLEWELVDGGRTVALELERR